MCSWVNFTHAMCLLLVNSDSTRKICKDFFSEKESMIDVDYYNAIVADLNEDINSKYIDPSTRAVRLSLYIFDILENNFISLEPVNIIFCHEN